MTNPSIRKPLGVLLILGIIFVWALIVVQASGLISTLPALVQGIIYLVAGIAWIVPMGPILRWMEGGR